MGRRLSGADKVGKYRGAPIAYTRDVGPVSAPGALWIGESARLTNAATGEGIFYAMKSAQLAAQALQRHPRADAILYEDYTRATHRTFTWRLQAAVAFLRFVGTPAFSWVSSLVTHGSVQKPVTWLLSNV